MTQTIDSPSLPGMDVSDGLLRFERRDDGGVNVCIKEGENASTIVVLDDATWASVVCSVSDRGEEAYRWYQALAFHSRAKTLAWLMAVGDPIRHFLTHVADRLMFGLHRGVGDETLRIRADGTVERS